MGMFKYILYLGLILGIAYFFETIMVTIYDLTVQGVTGDISAYVGLLLIYVILYVAARLVFNKKIYKQSSQFVLWASMLHIGGTLAAFFYNSEPLLLITFPMIFVIAYWTRYRSPTSVKKIRFKSLTIHPEFIDDRGGVCVLRVGPQGFRLLKFFQLDFPFPRKEILLYIFHNKLNCSFEMHRTSRGVAYYLGLITEGRNYNAAHEQCVKQGNHLRQFLRREGVRFNEIQDIINLQRIFYATYFLEAIPSLNPRGRPAKFPTVSSEGENFVIEEDFSERTFQAHIIEPKFTENVTDVIQGPEISVPWGLKLYRMGIQLHKFLRTTYKGEFYIQYLLHPLSEEAIEERGDALNQDYIDSFGRLAGNWQENDQLQAACYAFKEIGIGDKDKILPLLDKEEVKRFERVNQNIDIFKKGKEVGLWEFRFCVVGAPGLATSVVSRTGGSRKRLPPSAITHITTRSPLGTGNIVDSRGIEFLLPGKHRVKRQPVETKGSLVQEPTEVLTTSESEAAWQDGGEL